MNDQVKLILDEYVSTRRSSGRTDPLPFLKRVDDQDRVALSEAIEAVLTSDPTPPFDPGAFARFQADPVVQAQVQSILSPDTVESLRVDAGLSRAEVARELTARLDLGRRVQAVRDRYDAIEQADSEPRRVRQPIWDHLGELFGVMGVSVRDAAVAAFKPSATGGRSAVGTRSSGTSSADDETDPEVDRAFFLDS